MTIFFRRPPGRFFLCALISVLLAVHLHATGPALTTVSDIVYRADGSPASGTIVITWPNFTTADNKAVAAGQLNLTIGPGGVMSAALAPNQNSTPAGTYYKVVYKLDDGTTSTEFWVVPALSPTTIAAIRATVVPTQVAAQLASRQYVDSAVAGDTVVHKAGAESISGAKAFAVSPTAPAPSTSGAVATKGYVDSAVSSATDFVHITGDTMTGALLLPADPASDMQATTRHYVDLQVQTLTGGISTKLGRLNDSPITLAGVRYADQFAGNNVSQQIDAACADLSGANGIVVVPSTLGAGWSQFGIPSNCTIYDFRGAGGSTQTAYTRGLGYYGRYTQVGTGLQIVSPMLIEFDAYSGGVNNIATTKTQWQGLRISGVGRTIGERKGIEINVAAPGKGDNIGIMASTYDSGGYSTGGDEGSEGGRFMSMQGDSSADGGFPRGTVASVTGNTVSGTWTTGAANLGEQRPLINTSRGLYNTGTVASVTASGSPVVCTVNGSGTGWSSLGVGAKSDLFLEISGNSNGAIRHVVPITSITDDTHLVVEYQLAELGPSCYGASMVTSGAYNIYKGGMVQSLAAPPQYSLNATDVTLASGGANFVAGDPIQMPLGYNYHGVGAYAVVSRVVGEPQGAGVYANNVGALAYRDGFRASGKFVNGISFDNGTLTGHGVLFGAPVSGALLRSNDMTATSQNMYSVLSGAAALRSLTYDRSNDLWQWSGGQYFNAADQRIGIGTSPQPSTLGYFYYNNAAWDGLILAPAATPNAGKAIFDTQVAGIPRLRVENTRVIVNNASDLVGFSDNQATQKWKITGADGTILGSTINATAGFQVNGAALNFTNIAGTLSVSAGGTGTTTATGTAGSVVLSNSPTIVTPTIASFTSAQHDHSSAAGGGQISTTAVAAANKTGTGAKFATGTGTYTSGDCVKINASGDLIDNGAPCGGGTAVQVAGSGIAGTTANFNATTQAIPSGNPGAKPVTFKADAGAPTTNISGYVSGFIPRPGNRRWQLNSGDCANSTIRSSGIAPGVMLTTQSGNCGDANNGPYQIFTSAATSGVDTGFYDGGSNWSRWGRNNVFQTYADTDSTATRRVYLGLVGNTTIANWDGTDDPNTIQIAAFHLKVSGTNWFCYLANAGGAGNSTDVDSGIAVSTGSPGTLQNFEIREDSTGFTFYINGTQVCAAMAQTNKPSGTNNAVGTTLTLRTTAATASILRIGFGYLEADK